MSLYQSKQTSQFWHRVTSYGFSVVHKKEAHITKILITVVIVFLLLNLPRLVVGLYEISR